MIKTYKDLIVWQRAVELVLAVYALTAKFPREEVYGLVSQMRRAAVSIPSNIAEGKLRGYSKECRQFFLIAYGSAGELETQIIIARKLPGTANLEYGKVEPLLSEVMRMLNTMIGKTPSLTPKA